MKLEDRFEELKKFCVSIENEAILLGKFCNYLEQFIPPNSIDENGVLVTTDFYRWCLYYGHLDSNENNVLIEQKNIERI